MEKSLHSRAAELAANLVGGATGLAAYLKVSPKDVGDWICSRSQIPQGHFMKIVDVICDDLSMAERHALNAARHVAQVSQFENTSSRHSLS